jgi:hypothetical protein
MPYFIHFQRRTVKEHNIKLIRSASFQRTLNAVSCILRRGGTVRQYSEPFLRCSTHARVRKCKLLQHLHLLSRRTQRLKHFAFKCHLLHVSAISDHHQVDFRELRMQLQAREFKWGFSVNKWSDVKCRDGGNLTWFMWSDIVMKKSEVKWSDVKWVGEVFVYVH